jgi:hypothetical protein
MIVLLMALEPLQCGTVRNDLPLGRSNDHPKPPEVEIWRIFLELLARMKQKRPLIAPRLEAARPGNYSQGVFELRFGKEHSITCESLSRPNNAKAISEVLSEIVGTETKPSYLLVNHL